MQIPKLIRLDLFHFSKISAQFVRGIFKELMGDCLIALDLLSLFKLWGDIAEGRETFDHAYGGNK